MSLPPFGIDEICIRVFLNKKYRTLLSLLVQYPVGYMIF